MVRAFRKFFIAAVFVFSGIATTQLPNSKPVKAAGLTAFVYNTQIATNNGLSFCAADTTKGCIDSLTIDGQPVTQASSIGSANFVIAGGLYSPYCRFVETEAVPCEVPYLVIYPMSYGRPSASTLGEVVLNFRRAKNDLPTTRFGTVVVNGLLQSFNPAASGIRDVATVAVKSTPIQQATVASSSWCNGWVIAIDNCAVPDNATGVKSNQVSILLLPGMRSSIVPPDKLDPTCTPSMTNGCVIPVFEEVSFGGWAQTDAFIFGMSSADRDTGASQMQVAGPHFKYPENGVTDALNLSFYHVFMPSAFLMTSFGLTPSEANEVTLPVKRTVGNTSTIPTTLYKPSADGLVIETSGIGFSTPTVSVQRVFTVKKNKKVSSEQILRAAGVFHSKQFGNPKIIWNKRAGFTKVGKKYVFKKARNLRVVIKYKSTSSDTAYRYLSVKVAKK